jgi:hypothetical protein
MTKVSLKNAPMRTEIANALELSFMELIREMEPLTKVKAGAKEVLRKMEKLLAVTKTWEVTHYQEFQKLASALETMRRMTNLSFSMPNHQIHSTI